MNKNFIKTFWKKSKLSRSLLKISLICSKFINAKKTIKA